MALNTCEMRSNGIKIAFFSQKLRKIAQRLCPQTPVCDTFDLQYTSLLNTSPNLNILTTVGY